MSFLEVVTLPESHPDYPVEWLSDCQRFRVIRCKDNLQWIVQCWQSPKWRSLSYHREWWTIAYRWAEAEGGPFDGLPERPVYQLRL